MGVVLTPASQQFGRYQLLEYLGSGGMSDVFVALHTGLRKRVALKLLRPSLRHDAQCMERFLREGECAARVSHPNVVDVTDVGTEQGVPFLVMELLDGETLEEKLERDGPFTLQAAVDLLLPILDGVAATHRAGVLHRDIKPGNVLLARVEDGSVVPKLVDFGIATLEERRNITGAIGPIGTPHYMSPEQARGQRGLDERSDQYSLASMLFEMLTGRAPFGDGDINAVLLRVARGRFPRVCEARSGLPAALDDVMQRATALDPAHRYPSVTDFAHALLPFASARTRKLWISRDARAGLLSAHLLSGVWRAEGDPHETMRLQAPLIERSVRPSRPMRVLRHPQTLVTTMAALGLLAGLAVGFVHVRQDPASPGVTTFAAMPRAAAEPHPHQGAPLAPPPARVIDLSPVTAEAVLDGKSLGFGVVPVPSLQDDAVHELRVSAPGYIPRVVLFRKALATSRIALDPMPGE